MKDVGIVGTVETSFIRNRRGTPDPKQRIASSVPSLSLSFSLSIYSFKSHTIVHLLHQFLVSLSLYSDNCSDNSLLYLFSSDLDYEMLLCFRVQAMVDMICGVCSQPSHNYGRAERKTTSFTLVVGDGFQDSVVCP
jgi:hypothetical protein